MEEITEQSHGVQELIDQLRAEGVQAGREEADQIMRRAEESAADIVRDAKDEAERIRNEARQTISEESAAAKAALTVAIRDTELKLKAEIMALFSVQLRRLVRREMSDPKLLRKLILAVAGQARNAFPEDQAFDVLVPETTDKGDPLQDLVHAISSEILREGVELKTAKGVRSGIRIRLQGEDMEIDLTDESVSDLLLERLLPRFRAVAEGVGL